MAMAVVWRERGTGSRSSPCRNPARRIQFTARSMADPIATLLAHRRIAAARDHLERHDERTLARQAELCAIPAPTGEEGRRAARMVDLLREAGLAEVRIDGAGNVV